MVRSEKKNSIFLAPSSTLRDQNHRTEREVENSFLCDLKIESQQGVALW